MIENADDYPAWVCHDCGTRYGRRKPGISSWHLDHCGVCGKHVPCTEPRDFGHLKAEWKLHGKAVQP